MSVFTRLLLVLAFIITASCGDSDSSSSSSCALAANTTETSTTNSFSCALLTRDTSSCESERTAQGLSGYWLKFSCRVTLTVSGTNVIITTDGQPDYQSFYFSETDLCYENVTLEGRSANRNTIGEQSISVTVPLSPTATTHSAQGGGVIGIAVNGVSIYNNAAAPGDNIYDEVATFDKCEGHPDGNSRYHYHTEPHAISNADEQFIGIMRDGFPIYGRYGHGTSADVTGLDVTGGHTSTTVDSTSTAVFHYHVNLQSEGSDSAYFIASGFYRGTQGSCTGCQ